MKFLKIRDTFYINTNNIIQLTQSGNDVLIEYQIGQVVKTANIFDIKIDELVTRIQYDSINSYLYDIKQSLSDINYLINTKLNR
jgi:hypothetical protein